MLFIFLKLFFIHRIRVNLGEIEKDYLTNLPNEMKINILKEEIKSLLNPETVIYSGA